MKGAERQLKIRQMLGSRDFVDLETLRRELGTSESSVRRDLDRLERGGVLKRVYGGALNVQPAAGDSFSFAVETQRLSAEKSRMAKLVAGLIEDGQTVILDGGSSVAAVAAELLARPLHVVTNSLPIAEILEEARSIELTLTGGYLDSRLRVMLGPFTEQMLGAIRADVLVMGVGSVSEAGFSNNHTLLVGTEQKMMSAANRVIIVADHTKFGRSAMVPVAPLSAAHVLVSDAGLDPKYVTMLEDHGLEVYLASSAEGHHANPRS